MAATHPPASPVEEHHQQSASEKSQDSLINLLIVPERDKDRYCRRGRGRDRKLRLGCAICSGGVCEKRETSNAGKADENGYVLPLL